MLLFIFFTAVYRIFLSLTIRFLQMIKFKLACFRHITLCFIIFMVHDTHRKVKIACAKYSYCIVGVPQGSVFEPTHGESYAQVKYSNCFCIFGVPQGSVLEPTHSESCTCKIQSCVGCCYTPGMATDMFWYHLHKENVKNQKMENDQK